jgi:integrase
MTTTTRIDRGLVRRGNQYWFWLAIPHGARHLFPPSKNGNAPDKVAKALGPNLDVARPIAATELAKCKTIFANIDAGSITTRKQVAQALRSNPMHTYLEREAYRHVMATIDMQEINEHATAIFEVIRRGRVPIKGKDDDAQPVQRGETISAAMEPWLKELQRRKSNICEDTIDRHRKYVQKFIAHCGGDILLANVTQEMASNFLQLDGRANRTRNNYGRTLRGIFRCAAQRGQFKGVNPFEDQRFEEEEKDVVPFTIPELQKLFDALPPREIAPECHTIETALPWCALLSLYSGMRLGEVAGMEVADIRYAEVDDDNPPMLVFDLHYSPRRRLKNKYSIRLVPVHDDLIKKHKLLDYIKHLPQDGPLFPGVKAQKKTSYGKRVGDAFRDLREELGITEEGKKFHSLRHNVSNVLDTAEVRASDVSRLLGQEVDGIAFGTYSKEGPGLKVVKDSVVDKIKYKGLRL